MKMKKRTFQYPLIFTSALLFFINHSNAYGLDFKINDYELKGLLIAWMSMAVAYFFITYSSDVMQYPNSIIFFTSVALCINASKLDKRETKSSG